MLVTITGKTVTNISKLSPTHFVANVRHQHRCSQSWVTVLSLSPTLDVALTFTAKRDRKIQNFIFERNLFSLRDIYILIPWNHFNNSGFESNHLWLNYLCLQPWQFYTKWVTEVNPFEIGNSPWFILRKYLDSLLNIKFWAALPNGFWPLFFWMKICSHIIWSINWGAPSRWSFRPISAWGSIETMRLTPLYRFWFWNH